ncbi:MAG: right-handed parallel beta-helix repeat-containing protein [Pseudomonadota bacterium]|nr:right-handed parallel beta-helix repeat-containing protein [Pseudomonadota bacterium]
MNIDVSAAIFRYRCGIRLMVLTALIALIALTALTSFAAGVRAVTLPVPQNIANGATVLLQCGVIYQGTLALNRKTGVTVKTSGDCGKAGISPRRAVSGWIRQSGNIYSAPVDFIPVQVTIGSDLLGAAHWPNQGWATSTARLPAGVLAGATLVTLVNQSVIRTRTLAGNLFSAAGPFYVEGKLWMLDIPGEWAVRKGRLYVWAPDGRSPEGRAWAAPDANGIDADDSTGIVIDGVTIFSASDGISAHGASRLTVRNTTIIDSYRDGIWASGSDGLQVQGSSILNARRNGIDGWYGINGAVITASRVSNTGMVGMPSASDAAIMFGAGANNRIEQVRISNSAYHGINIMQNRHTSLRASVIETACVRLTDCGAIYTSARDRQPLDQLIESNTVRNTRGREAIGIYLDDYANGVTVRANTLVNNERALVIHDGYNNVISGNTFASSAVLHIGLSQSAGRIHHVRITGNTFQSAGGEQTFNLEGANYRRFATYDDNIYISHPWAVFSRAWDGRSAAIDTSYQGWKRLMQQDKHSIAIDAVSHAAPAAVAAQTSAATGAAAVPR